MGSAPGLGPQQARGPGVLREDDARRLQRLQLFAQRLQLLRLRMRQHVAQRRAARQRRRCTECLHWQTESVTRINRAANQTSSHMQQTQHLGCDVEDMQRQQPPCTLPTTSSAWQGRVRAARPHLIATVVQRQVRDGRRQQRQQRDACQRVAPLQAPAKRHTSAPQRPRNGSSGPKHLGKHSQLQLASQCMPVKPALWHGHPLSLQCSLRMPSCHHK